MKMTENNSFNASNLKNICRACLKVSEKLYAMTIVELDAYLNLIAKMNNKEDKMNLCSICYWTLKKIIKFTQQCQRANEVLNKAMEEDTKPILFLPQTSMYDLKTHNIGVLYFGPEMAVNGTEKEEYAPLHDKVNGDDIKDDEVNQDDEFNQVDKFNQDDEINQDDEVNDDDDEIPLVMLQDDFKSKRRSLDSYEQKLEIEIKDEPEIKEEIKEYFKPKVRSKKKKKEVKEGFSSRMVRETEEYVVIKLTKKQVLAELAENAKTEKYIRSPYKCEKCAKGFNFEDVLAAHMVKHTREHGTYKCDMCTQYCPSPVSLRGHIKSHTTRYKCKLCGHIRLSRQHLLEHHAITHAQGAATYTCDQCQYTTTKRTTIQRHVRTHSSIARHACHRCGKLFSTIETLRVHTMRHDKSKRFQCSQCDKHFIYPSLLQKHVSSVHEGREHYCVECDVRFTSSETLRLHFKRAKRHRDSSSYKHKCPQCPQRFISSSTLLVHLTCTHGVPKQYSCEICHRQYSNRESLRAHSWRVHHGDAPAVVVEGKS